MSRNRSGRDVSLYVLAGLASLCVLAYLRSLSLPLISDDYLQIGLAREYGPVSGWGKLSADALYRCRATSLAATYWTERLFGLAPLAYNLSSLAVHVFNTWLVFALGVWRPVGWRVSAVAAAFFAVYEGHQGAVMWYAALPELLVFFFALLSLLFWVLWIQAAGPRFGWPAASLAAFVLALGSKESAVVVAPLLVVIWWAEPARNGRRLLAAIPFAALAGAYALSIYAARSAHLFFHDGTFSLRAPFWITLANSTGRLFWFWGFLALLALSLWRARKWRALLVVSGAWILIAFLPYSFLTYMPRVPSRHTYLASAGLALIVAAAMLAARERLGMRAAAVIASLMVVHNCGYVWTRKYMQYVERAAPTEALIEFARARSGPVYLHCFPYDISVAQFAAKVRLNKAVYAMPARLSGTEAVFCWRGDYQPHRSESAPPL